MRFQHLEIPSWSYDRLFPTVSLPWPTGQALPWPTEQAVPLATATGLATALQRWPGPMRQAAVRTSDAWLLTEVLWYRGRFV
jgi:hypothetical protein